MCIRSKICICIFCDGQITLQCSVNKIVDMILRDQADHQPTRRSCSIMEKRCAGICAVIICNICCRYLINEDCFAGYRGKAHFHQIACVSAFRGVAVISAVIIAANKRTVNLIAVGNHDCESLCSNLFPQCACRAVAEFCQAADVGAVGYAKINLNRSLCLRLRRGGHRIQTT